MIVYYFVLCIGVGALFSGGPTPDVLQEVEVSYVTNAVCDNKYASYDIDGSMMCAADPGEGKIVHLCCCSFVFDLLLT